MARKKKEEGGGGGAPGWMATFSDLMNLLLCFFVLLFSMSSVDAAKFEAVVASLQSSFSILPAGGSSIGDAGMISSGISQLENLDIYINPEATSSDGEDTSDGETEDEELKEAMETIEEAELKESEEMAEQIEKLATEYGIQDQIEVNFNGEYVQLTLNGAILFDSGSADIKEDALPLIDKIGAILNRYQENDIEIEGHTDNVPINGARFESNDVLSMYRALSVADYIRSITEIPSGHIKSSGRGEYVPIADNGTPEGRARNRRVEIKLYNSYHSGNNY